MPYVIEENNLAAVDILLKEIPEFDIPPTLEDIIARIKDVPHLVLTVHDHGMPVGFKIGYERDGHFYSWLGGVSPRYRQRGIASLLANHQEQWVKNQGYSTIWMKTRNRFPEMLLMAVRRGFRIAAIEPREKIGEHRIVLQKSL